MKVLVIGDSCKDVFFYGRCPRLAPEGPAPVFHKSSTHICDGMAKNVLRNFEALTPQADTSFLTQTEEISKVRYIEETTNHLLLRADSDAKKSKRVEFEELKKEVSKGYDMIIVSDYDKGFLEVQDLEWISKNHDLTIMDTKKILGPWAKHFSFIKINQEEYHRFRSASSLMFLEEKNRRWLKKSLIVTEGSQGCTYNFKRYHVEEVEIRDFAGAGDTFLAAFSSHYIQQRSVPDSLRFANRCATQVVQKKGVVCVQRPV